MADNKSRRGNPDRSRVAANERYEIEYLAKKRDMPAALVKKIAEQVGPSRAAVEAKLEEMKENGRKK
jgi:biotin operon repressor